MKIKKIVLIMLLSALAINSCGQKKEDDLEIEVTPTTGILLDYDFETCNSMYSNYNVAQPSRSWWKGPVIMFNRLKMVWKQNYLLHIQSLKIDFDSLGFKANCSIPPNELASMFLFPGTTEGQANAAVYSFDGFITAGTVSSWPGCKLVCTVSVADPNNLELSGTGTVTVKGTSENGDVFARVKTRVSVNVTP